MLAQSVRTRADRCPGVLRPWPAEDGMLVRIRLVGGALEPGQVEALAQAARTFGDGRIRPTNRANLQLRAFPDDGTHHLTEDARTAVEASGLVASPQHDLVRNVMLSPLSGIEGGRADLTGVAEALDEGIRASEALTHLPGKFLFVLDDGRGDVLAHPCDAGLVALDEHTAQLRIGDGWGEVVPLEDAARKLLELAELFVERRGEGPEAAWHVEEMTVPFVETREKDPRVPEPDGPLPFGGRNGWKHVELGADGVPGEQLVQITRGARIARITPWYGIVVA